MSTDSASAHRAGRRALTRQSPIDLLNDSSSRGSSGSSSSSSTSSVNLLTPTPNLMYNTSPSVTTLVPPSKAPSSSNPQQTYTSQLVTTPDDEACFVDFQQRRRIGEWRARREWEEKGFLTCSLYADIISLLPSELSVYILSLLPHHGSVLSCTLVSKKWHSLCKDSQIWKSLFEGRAKDGWKVVGNVEEVWRAICKIDLLGHEDMPETAIVPLTPSKRRGKAVFVDEEPLSSRFEGDLSIQSIDSNLTVASIRSEQGEVNRIDWLTIYQARFALTQRWSLQDAEPEPATLDLSWGTGSYTSMASSAGTSSTSEQGGLSLPDQSLPVLTQDHSFNLVDKLLEGHTDSIYCIRFDHRPFKLPEELKQALQEDAQSGPLYDPRTSLGIGSYGKILSGSRDRTIKIWDGDSGICLHTLKGHGGSVLCLEYDDNFLFSGSSDESVVVWDFKAMLEGSTPTILKRLRGHRSPILDLTIDEKWLLTCGKDHTVRIYDRKQDFQLTRIYSAHNGPVNAVELTRSSIDGKARAMTVSGEGGAHLWEVETGTLVRQFVGHEKGLACVKVLDNKVIAGSNDMTVRVWDADTGQCLCVCRQHDDLVRAIGFDPQRNLILSGGYDGKIKLFNVGRELHPDAVLASEGNTLQPFWDIESQCKTRVFDVQMDSTRILCCGEDEHICVRDFGRGNPLMRLFV
jgi:WD40 repeat protein